MNQEISGKIRKIEISNDLSEITFVFEDEYGDNVGCTTIESTCGCMKSGNIKSLLQKALEQL